MKVTIACVGNIKQKYFSEAVLEYSKRLSRFCDLNIVECREVTMRKTPSEGDVNRILEEESTQLLKQLKGYKIALDIEGKEVTSPRFADVIKHAKDTCGAVTMAIGGSYGLADSVKNFCDQKISFGAVTYPHQLMRVILLEQTYRAFMILSGGEYHK